MTLSLSVVRGVCPHDCPDTCGLSITVEDGKATKIRGDTEHPFTHGFLCQKVNRYLERVYHPGRVLYPMKRVGAKGEGKFQRISWAEALTTIGDKLREIAASPDGPQAILPFSYSGTLGRIQSASLDRRFFHRLGASLLDRTICATAGAAGCDYTLGTRAVTDPESVVRSKLIINWGSNTAVTNTHLWRLMHEARKLGAKIVTIDPYRSPTAAKSDWWLAIRPGADGALALGMMHILFRDRLADEDYLARYCLGTEALRERVLEYPPERVARLTGLTVAEIERLAREYGTATAERPALIRLNYGLQRHGGGGMAVRNITCLPAIVGSWRYPGGGALLSTSKLIPFNSAALERPDLIPPGTRTINMVRLAEALNGDIPGPPVRALFVYGANPATVNPDQSRVIRGLQREDLFTVVHEQFQTDTADYADILLPATTQLEQFDLHNGYGHLYIQTNAPAIAPLGEAKCNTDLFRALGREMGYDPELFAASDERLAEVALSDPKSAAVWPKASAFDGIDLARLQAEGPVRIGVPRDYTPFASGEFGTPSGKCEFYSARLEAMGLDPLPTWTPPHEDPLERPDLAARYPLQLLTPPEPAFLNSSFVNVDSLRREAGEPKVEIHPHDAAARQIRQGDTVEVVNDRGRFTAKAVVGETVRRGVVVALGTWWSSMTDGGRNCNSTTSSALTDMGAGATFFDNLVEVRRRAGNRVE